MNTKIVDIQGKKFNRLTAIKYLKLSNWLCQCECGNTTIVRRYALENNKQKSCGCVGKETRKINNLKHGLSHTKEYRVWYEMIKRCTDTKNKAYKNYGERGITVYTKWLNSFETFLNDVGKAPSEKDTFDRIDNDGNYEPSNVRWVSAQVQNLNKRPYKTNKSGTTGVHFNKKKNKWIAQISVNKEVKFLGGFKTIKEAIDARKKAEEIYYKPLLDNA